MTTPPARTSSAADAATAASSSAVDDVDVIPASCLSAHPPRLDSVLRHAGSSRAFAIFVQEQANCSRPIQDAVVVRGGGSNPFASGAEWHNNGIPGMLVGCGRSASVDVEFYTRATAWQANARKIEGDAVSASANAAAIKRAPPPLPPSAAARSAVGATQAGAATAATATATDALTSHLAQAAELLQQYLVKPNQQHQQQPPSTSSTSSAAAASSASSLLPSSNDYPPLHIELTQAMVDETSAQVASAQSTRSPLSANLFQAYTKAVYAYLHSTYFALFLNTLAFDHLEVESLLLGEEDERRKFYRSAHSCYKEEYVLFYWDYERLRELIEHGPTGGETIPNVSAASTIMDYAGTNVTVGSGSPTLTGVTSPSAMNATGATTAGLATGASSTTATSASTMATASSGVSASAAASSSSSSSAVVGGAASSLSHRPWFDRVIVALDSLYRVYFHARAEYAIYVEPDIRLALTESLRATKRTGRVDLHLLNTLLTIKDYTVEVMKYDVLPAYDADAKVGHRRQRRASLIAEMAAGQALTATGGGAKEPAPIGRRASTSMAGPMLPPVMAAPIPPPVPTTAAAAAAGKTVPADAVALAAAERKSSSDAIAVGTDIGVVEDDSDDFLDARPPSSGGGGRRGSIANAAVDVPLGVRRISATHRPSHLLPKGAAAAGGDAATGAASTGGSVGATTAATTVGENANSGGSSSADTLGGASGLVEDASQDDAESSGARGPLPSSDPRARSFSDLKLRRSIVGSLMAGVPGAAGGGGGIPLSSSFSSTAANKDDSDTDDETEGMTVALDALALPTGGRPPSKTAIGATEAQFEKFSQKAEALLAAKTATTPTVSPIAASSPSSSSSSSSSAATTTIGSTSTSAAISMPSVSALNANAAASSIASSPFASMRRRSVLAEVPPTPAGASTMSGAPGTTSSSGASLDMDALFGPDREVRFNLEPAPETPSPNGGGLPRRLADGSTAASSSSAVVRSPKSILKTKLRSETMSELLRRIFLERLGESEIHLAALQAGCLILKYNAAGKAAERWFKVSPDGTELCWGKVDEKTKVPLKSGIFNRKKRFPLADVTRIRYGSSNSKRFAKYNLSAKSMPWMAWSVYFPGKTLDLVCRSEREVHAWFQGIQALAPLSTGYLSKASVIWRRVQMKIRYYSMWCNITPMLFVEDLLAAARQDVPLGRLPIAPVVDLLNSQIAATPEEGAGEAKGKKK